MRLGLSWASRGNINIWELVHPLVKLWLGLGLSWWWHIQVVESILVVIIIGNSNWSSGPGCVCRW